MPRGYEKMREKMIKQGYSPKEAKKKAARIYNKMHKTKVGAHHK